MKTVMRTDVEHVHFFLMGRVSSVWVHPFSLQPCPLQGTTEYFCVEIQLVLHGINVLC